MHWVVLFSVSPSASRQTHKNAFVQLNRKIEVSGGFVLKPRPELRQTLKREASLWRACNGLDRMLILNVALCGFGACDDRFLRLSLHSECGSLVKGLRANRGQDRSQSHVLEYQFRKQPSGRLNLNPLKTFFLYLVRLLTPPSKNK